MTGAASVRPRRRAARVRRLRVLAVVLILAAGLAYWQSSRPGTSPIGDGFLGALQVDGADWIVRGVPAEGGLGRFGVRAAEGGEERFFAGRPRAVVGVPAEEDEPGRLGVLFDDSITFRSVAKDDEREWVRVPFGPGFRARSATPVEGGVAVVGVVDDGAAAAVERVDPRTGESTRGDETWKLPEGVTPIGLDAASDELIVRVEDADGWRVEALAADGESSTLARGSGPAPAIAAAGRRVAWVDGTVVRVREADGTERVAGDLAAVGRAGRRRLALAGSTVYARSAGDVFAVAEGEVRAVLRASTEFWEYVAYLFAWLATMAGLVAARDARAAPPGTRLAALPARLPRRLAAWGLDVFGLAIVVLVRMSASGRDPERWLVDEAALGAVIVDWELINLIYFVFAEALFGSSLGKRALGLHVVDMHQGRRPGPIRAFLRNAVRFVDARGGAVLAILTPRRQRVGDWIARTMVVETYELPEIANPEPTEAGDGSPQP